MTEVSRRAIFLTGIVSRRERCVFKAREADETWPTGLVLPSFLRNHNMQGTGRRFNGGTPLPLHPDHDSKGLRGKTRKTKKIGDW
jgi:hypothetical protein